VKTGRANGPGGGICRVAFEVNVVVVGYLAGGRVVAPSEAATMLRGNKGSIILQDD